MASQNSMDRPLCGKGCGFFGSVETKMCSKCYADHLKQEMIAQALLVFELFNNSVTATTPAVTESGVDNSTGSTASTRTRCHCCNKKLGLLGFHCKCGAVFCGEHRYPEKHSCSLDLKTAGREVLA
ncbi:zinc finger A20 and AN1 domain-containing stress-associated protein 1-like [Argentina anserina]|uniref:zinc finger A20 and AN1 domain-containing stress-associated protein 1-like n=1 Tax=Argentina anserina TaxID=57926 RepID=UPI002176478C|nr:zinc finger A20 and AN1 domain-containing stress-associated protein 1-like [Potentilla anserina]